MIGLRAMRAGPKRGMARRHQHSVGNWSPLGAIVRLIYVAVTILYNVGDRSPHPWEWWSIGATGTTAFVLLTFTFSWFIDQFASYNSLYGSLGTY